MTYSQNPKVVKREDLQVEIVQTEQVRTFDAGYIQDAIIRNYLMFFSIWMFGILSSILVAAIYMKDWRLLNGIYIIFAGVIINLPASIFWVVYFDKRG